MTALFICNIMCLLAIDIILNPLVNLNPPALAALLRIVLREPLNEDLFKFGAVQNPYFKSLKGFMQKQRYRVQALPLTIKFRSWAQTTQELTAAECLMLPSDEW